MKKITAFLAALLFASLLCGCGSNEAGDADPSEYFVWYLSDAADCLEKRAYDGGTGSMDEILDGFLNRFRHVDDENADYGPLLTSDVSINSVTVENGLITLDFSAEYEKLDSVREVLVRAGIVRTLVQLSEVKEVLFTVNGKTGRTPGGRELEVMTEDSFIENSGQQINAIQHTAINLYFADEAGTSLRRESRSIYYSANKPLEWAIVERIIAGPKVSGNYSTVPSATQIISVTSANDICYVNLTQAFLTNALNVGELLPVYSIVNSITDNCSDINAVQLLVEGNSEFTFRQEVDLSHPLEPDMSLVSQE